MTLIYDTDADQSNQQNATDNPSDSVSKLYNPSGVHDVSYSTRHVEESWHHLMKSEDTAKFKQIAVCNFDFLLAAVSNFFNFVKLQAICVCNSFFFFTSKIFEALIPVEIILFIIISNNVYFLTILVQYNARKKSEDTEWEPKKSSCYFSVRTLFRKKKQHHVNWLSRQDEM